MKIIILALRRSGSTIFWKCFREMTKANCFYEPFNPKIFQLPKEHEKKTLREYVEFLEKDREKFWDFFTPIYPHDELKNVLTQNQSNYLLKLLNSSEDVVIDTTRCWNKLISLREYTNTDTFVIHLHRSPSSWITSHLLPSEQKSKKHILLNFRRKRSFWTRTSDFNRWSLEDIIGYEPLSPFHLLVLKDDQIAKRFYESPGVYRLLKFWTIAFQEAEFFGKTLFGDNFISIKFEDFCLQPTKVLQHISNITGLSVDLKKLPDIKPPSPAFMHLSTKWQSAARYWNLPDDTEYLHRRVDS